MASQWKPVISCTAETGSRQRSSSCTHLAARYVILVSGYFMHTSSPKLLPQHVHPFNKGKVERLVRFVKDNFLAGRTFWNYNDLNEAALQWCDRQNRTYHRAVDAIPDATHHGRCLSVTKQLPENPELPFYMCLERRISFDGFVNYEGRRFEVPYRHPGKTVRVCRRGTTLYIYTPDLKECLTTHEITWSRRDRFCCDQYANPMQPEELPTQRVTTSIDQLSAPLPEEAFDRFNFDKENLWNE